MRSRNKETEGFYYSEDLNPLKNHFLHFEKVVLGLETESMKKILQSWFLILKSLWALFEILVS